MHVEIGIQRPAGPVLKRGPDEAASLMDLDPGMTPTHGTGRLGQVPLGRGDRGPGRLDDRGCRGLVAQRPEKRHRLWHREGEIEPGLGGVAVQQPLPGQRMAELE